MLRMLKNYTFPDLHITSPKLHVNFFLFYSVDYFPALSCIKILDIYFFYLLLSLQ